MGYGTDLVGRLSVGAPQFSRRQFPVSSCYVDARQRPLLHLWEQDRLRMAERGPLPPDADLVKRLLSGDNFAFELLVGSYHGRMLRLASAIVGEAVADEVVQETWLAVIEALPGFEARASLKTWILRILVNKARSRLRHETRSIPVGELWDDDAPDLPAERFDSRGHWRFPPVPWHEETPEALLASEDLRQCLEIAMRTLPPAQRAVVTLRDLEALSMEEICNILAVSESNGRVLLHRGRNRLRAAIETYQRQA